MLRWVVVVVIVSSGCKHRQLPAGASGSVPIPHCTVGKPLPSNATIASVYQKTRDDPWQNDDLDIKEVYPGVSELGAHPCCDIPHLTVGWTWKCRFYTNADQLSHDLLLDHGWATADAAKRVEIAMDVDKFFGDPLQAPPKYWNPLKTFTPPKAEALPDGGVKLRRWIQTEEGGGMSAADVFYVLDERIVTADATLKEATEVERYEMSPMGYPDPALLASCDPTKPPTKEWAWAAYLEASGGGNSQGHTLDKLTFVNVRDDVWAFQWEDFDKKPHALWYFRQCKTASDSSAL